VVIVFIAALALGRLAVIGARDVELVTGRVAPDDTEGESQRPNVFRRLISARSSSDGGDDD